MFFLFRTAFWFSLVLLILPFGGTGDEQGDAVSPVQAFFAASEAVSDVSGICERKPEVCEVGKSAFQTIGVRARESAKIAYELLDRQFGESAGPTGTDNSVQTGSIEAIIESSSVN